MCRLSDPEQPVFWLDMMPDKSVKSGFNFRMNLLRFVKRQCTSYPTQLRTLLPCQQGLVIGSRVYNNITTGILTTPFLRTWRPG